MSMLLSGVGSDLFNPLLDIKWAHAGWASDPLWGNPGNGNAVAGWRDVGGNNVVQATSGNQPLYESSVSVLNNQAAVYFNAGAGNQNLDASVTVMNYNFTIVSVATATAVLSPVRMLGVGSSSTAGHGHSGSGYWAEEGVISTTLNDGNPHLMSGFVTGSTGALLLDGTSIATGTMTGTVNETTIGSSSQSGAYAYYMTGYMAFWGYYSGDFRNDPNYYNFKRWVNNYYGFTVN